ncbi:GFA family protein [Bradyrhizobium sp. CCBAU 53338]|uniref:GFA family protein n=1 Tax=Bradyrhizobium sp. CCBAU 53338 TaxID=1325111 RepID=UPI00188A2AFE|nr:GFA family protein [Bradyrhizobium sp. CCBAU 53338]QOZ51514.1 hypothetical protein XH90_09080 [Bradyrhizobium sp. CCBAU 53338]
MARHDHTHFHGSCTCGTFSFETRKAPVTRFVCHCTFCQDFTGQAFSDVSVLRSRQIVMKGTEALVFTKYRSLPPNLNRGRCRRCGKPAMETMRAGPQRLVFIPSALFTEQDLLPPIRLHAFYNRRVADVADDLPKYERYWPSQFAITRSIMGF